MGPEQIAEGTARVKASPAAPAPGEYQLQAAIAALHAQAPSAGETDWPQVHALYLILERIAPNPMVTLNRAIALAETESPLAGLALLSTLDRDERMAGHHRLLSVRAHLLEKTGDTAGAWAHDPAGREGHRQPRRAALPGVPGQPGENSSDEDAGTARLEFPGRLAARRWCSRTSGSSRPPAAAWSAPSSTRTRPLSAATPADGEAAIEREICGGGRSPSCPTLQPMNEPVMTERTLAVSVPGGELIGVRSGSGRPLLVLHGGPAMNDYSHWFATELGGWDTFRYTQRGVGPSVTEGPFTIAQHVSDAVAVLDEHGVAAATVLGHSWAAPWPCNWPRARPGRVNALVLADTLGAVGDGGLAGFGAELDAPGDGRSPGQDGAGTGRARHHQKEDDDAVALEYFRLDWPGYFAVPAQPPPVPHTVRVNAEAFEQTSASVAEAVKRGDLPGLLSGYTGPVEIVAGECSPLPRQAAESTAAVFPDARLTIVTGAGHQVWHEAPGCLAAALNRVAARLG